MGNLHKRNGVYYADYVDRSGQRQQPSLRTRDREVAKAKLRELELQTTDRSPHQTETLGEALDYFTDVACAGKSPGTVNSYEQKARHVARLLGHELLDLLKRETIERYIKTRIAEGSHTHSVHKELVVLRGALNSAAERDRFHGVVKVVVPKFNAEYEPRRTYLTPEQFMALTDNILRPLGAGATEAQRARWEARKAKRTLYVLLIALASPRVGEIEALDWGEHVHLDRNILLIPKGKTVSRPVKIHPVLRLWLEAHQSSGPVVEPWGNVSRDLPRLCERAGIPRCTPNDLRRTFASWLVQQGESLFVVSRLLGHKSTRMVELVYGQLDEATLSRAIDRLPGGSHAGYTNNLPNRVTGGAIGTSPSAPTITNSVENSVNSAAFEVPKDGVEPPTRGFSVPLLNQDKPAQPRAKLRLVG